MAKRQTTSSSQDSTQTFPKHTHDFWTSDTKLASLLVSVGIPFNEKFRLKKVKLAGKPNTPTQKRWYFDFADYKHKSGLNADDVLNAWKNWITFTKENPDSPIAQAIATIKNYDFMIQRFDEKSPENTFVRYDLGNKQPVFLVKEGSKKHKQMQERFGK